MQVSLIASLAGIIGAGTTATTVFLANKWSIYEVYKILTGKQEELDLALKQQQIEANANLRGTSGYVTDSSMLYSPLTASSKPMVSSMLVRGTQSPITQTQPQQIQAARPTQPNAILTPSQQKETAILDPSELPDSNNNTPHLEEIEPIPIFNKDTSDVSNATEILTPNELPQQNGIKKDEYVSKTISPNTYVDVHDTPIKQIYDVPDTKAKIKIKEKQLKQLRKEASEQPKDIMGYALPGMQQYRMKPNIRLKAEKVIKQTGYASPTYRSETDIKTFNTTQNLNKPFKEHLSRLERHKAETKLDTQQSEVKQEVKPDNTMSEYASAYALPSSNNNQVQVKVVRPNEHIKTSSVVVKQPVVKQAAQVIKQQTDAPIVIDSKGVRSDVKERRRQAIEQEKIQLEQEQERKLADARAKVEQEYAEKEAKRKAEYDALIAKQKAELKIQQERELKRQEEFKAQQEAVENRRKAELKAQQEAELKHQNELNRQAELKRQAELAAKQKPITQKLDPETLQKQFINTNVNKNSNNTSLRPATQVLMTQPEVGPAVTGLLDEAPKTVKLGQAYTEMYQTSYVGQAHNDKVIIKNIVKGGAFE